MYIATLPLAVMGQRILDFLVFWSTYSTRIESAGKSASGPFRRFKGLLRGGGNSCQMGYFLPSLRLYQGNERIHKIGSTSTNVLHIHTWAQFMSLR